MAAAGTEAAKRAFLPNSDVTWIPQDKERLPSKNTSANHRHPAPSLQLLRSKQREGRSIMYNIVQLFKKKTGTINYCSRILVQSCLRLRLTYKTEQEFNLLKAR